MKVSRKGEGEINITIDGETLEQVDRFRYLGDFITSDGRCETEIKTRIGMAKNAFNQRKELLSKSLNKDIKKRIIKAIVWSVALYAAETWKSGKKISEDWRLLRCGCGGGWKRSAGETCKQMKRYYNWYKKTEALWM